MCSLLKPSTNRAGVLPVLRNIALQRLWLKKVLALAKMVFLIAPAAAWEFVKINKDKISWDFVVLNPPYASYSIIPMAMF